MIGDYALPAALAVTLPGMLAWASGRRFGLAGLIAVMILVGVMAIVGWNLTLEVLTGDDQLRRSSIIFFVVVPGIVSVVLGAIAGFWEAHRRRL
ncbi:hypothetical protein [Paracoccus sp. (in: a-proteobacteria)]|uniref:hypothetical protein n=1 Tax=Paracoccus sp. TaxID=267 RepID=UPI0026DEF169|nr:hypothetical protein [Paracoccus sp. (in: a-proteobacteria)]MDO5369892.1 hypothetical protein [Paracoccus sp. (in: a-proteobacteria)]